MSLWSECRRDTGPRRRGPPPPGLSPEYPARIAEQMARQYGELDAEALRLVDLYLVPAIIADDPTAINIALGKIKDALAQSWPDSRAEDIARKTATSVDRQHAHGFYAGLGMAIGAVILGSDIPSSAPSNSGVLGAGGGNPPIFPSSPTFPSGPSVKFGVKVSVAPALFSDEYVKESTWLIGNLRQGIIPGLEDAIVRARQFGVEGEVRGETPDELARRLRDIWQKNGVPAQLPTTRLKANGEPVMLSTYKHAQMVAEDQLAKLNAKLTETRQVASGISSFTWTTRGDSRVRPAHQALSGKVFEWASGGAPGVGLPGEPPRCRCVGAPVIDREQILKNLVPL